ncbi:MAG: D-alanine--D-alanine ligase, partial [Burkholderiales bacterium]|nr:D-alanine--D-alanine ligase [Flavobacterium sp.]
ITAGSTTANINETISDLKIKYPFIVKPDIGLRGSAVKKIHTEAELETYNAKANFDYLVQNLITYPNEIGIFYVRYPNESAGRISGIVAKEFLIVTGDGRATIEMLLKQNPRYEMQLKVLQSEYGQQLQQILALGEQKNLVPYGNHIRGAKFVDRSQWITPKLSKVINQMCLQIPGFYFGRLDLMYNSLAELEIGEQFAIVELNGAASEPTHIYDPRHSLFFGWKELLRHITYMYEISVQNHKNGVPYLSHKVGMKEYRLHLEHSKKIVNF